MRCMQINATSFYLFSKLTPGKQYKQTFIRRTASKLPQRYRKFPLLPYKVKLRFRSSCYVYSNAKNRKFTYCLRQLKSLFLVKVNISH